MLGKHARTVPRRLREVFLGVAGFFVPVFQFVPNTWMFFGLMSMPLVGYVSSLRCLPHLFDELGMMLFDFGLLFGWHGLQELAGVIQVSFLAFLTRGLIVGGLVLFLFSLGYTLKHRGGLVRTGPYGWVRHPQYLGLLMMTGGITLHVIRMDPIWVWRDSAEPIAGAWVSIVWLLEVLAYVALAKIEDLDLKRRYGEMHARYAQSVPFIIP